MRDLAKDKAMCEAATPGAWRESMAEHSKTENYRTIEAGDGYFKEDFVCDFGLTGFIKPADTHFIVEARQALPYWMNQYEAAQAHVNELEAYISLLETHMHTDVPSAVYNVLRNKERLKKPQEHFLFGDWDWLN
ncbi:hypothetical protein GZH47_08235 [Paenibacillus rhizovicinus]|uniref:Uncharacterized protein n=1 Tax=Paenibacillus rhizovicinus TaxID=2704463 RepID=A0A6C0P2E0_9BACL|nr:hypothetical protein [Paenibacillus rhizovicinus]QHW30842.1 hypothetical protein GZH47_08235 [Paenibacillus rhizovicinus]